RQLTAQLSFRIHRALSLRPSDQHRLYGFFEPVQLRSSKAGVAALRPKRQYQPPVYSKLQSKQHGVYGVCKLSAAKVFFHARGANLRTDADKHHSVQRRVQTAVSVDSISKFCRPERAEWNCFEHDYANDHL